MAQVFRKNLLLALPVLFGLLGLLPSISFGQTGYLHIASSPEQAEIFIGSARVARGRTPLRLELPVGTHSIRITKEYYQDQTVEVIVREDRVERINVALQRGSKWREVKPETKALPRGVGVLTILTDIDGASVAIDGQALQSSTPITVENIEAGPHSLRVELEGMVEERQIVIAPKRTTKIELRFRDRLARAKAEEDRLRVEREALERKGEETARAQQQEEERKRREQEELRRAEEERIRAINARLVKFTPSIQASLYTQSNPIPIVLQIQRYTHGKIVLEGPRNTPANRKYEFRANNESVSIDPGTYSVEVSTYFTETRGGISQAGGAYRGREDGESVRFDQTFSPGVAVRLYVKFNRDGKLEYRIE